MSMMNCEKCGTAVDTDFHCEMFREGFKLVNVSPCGVRSVLLKKTDNPKDVAAICDYCFEAAGFEEE